VAGAAFLPKPYSLDDVSATLGQIVRKRERA